MTYEVVALNPEHLDKLLAGVSPALAALLDRRSYFTSGSSSLCLIVDGEPVFAGGIVNLQWHRGEAWLLPTRFFREHLLTCLRAMRAKLPLLVSVGEFQRVQATCARGVSERLFRHLGFDYEGTMRKFGPSGETCSMYARIFEVQL
jgi:hypothetical protein